MALPPLCPLFPPLPTSPLQVTISLLEAAMDASGAQRFLIDGFPRNEENRASFESQVGMGSVYGGAEGGSASLLLCCGAV